MIARFTALCLLALLLQAECHAAKDPVASSTSRQVSRLLGTDELVSFVMAHSELLEELMPSVATVLYNIATCKTETRDMVSNHIGDVMSCINITLSLYDSEVLLLHMFQFGLDVYDHILDLGSNIEQCRNGTSNLFEIIECSYDSIKSSSSLFDVFLNRTAELVGKSEQDYESLMDNIDKCKGVNMDTLLRAWDLIHSQC